jgi:UDP-N-acetylglucosamine 3-dehydrogenase
VVPQTDGAPKIGGGKLTVAADEPLKRELEDFLAAVREGRAPAVSGEEGRAALALAVRIVELMGQP